MSNLDQLLRHGVWQELLVKFANKLFDVFTFLVIAQGDSLSVGASTRSTTNSMQVSLGLDGETEVEDSSDGGNIKTSSNQVGRQKEVSVTALEGLNICESLILWQITMDFDRL